MSNTRAMLAQLESHLDESMGLRANESMPRLAPMPARKDAGRRPLRGTGTIEIDRVVPDPDQPRTTFSQEAIEQLAASIRGRGQLMPIHVRWSEEMDKWVIISGERRWRAVRCAGLPTINCVFKEEPLSASEVREHQLIENLLREDLKPVEQARAFAELMAMNGWNGKRLADTLRIPPSSVSRALALLKLPTDLQSQVDGGELSSRSAYELSKLGDDAQRRSLAAKAAAGTLTHDQAAKAVRQRQGKKKHRSENVRVVFCGDDGCRVTVLAERTVTYLQIQEALLSAAEEARIRHSNDVPII